MTIGWVEEEGGAGAIVVFGFSGSLAAGADVCVLPSLTEVISPFAMEWDLRQLV